MIVNIRNWQSYMMMQLFLVLMSVIAMILVAVKVIWFQMCIRDSYAAVQINDTHPSMVIPELIRLLQEKGILMDEAIAVSYTHLDVYKRQGLEAGKREVFLPHVRRFAQTAWDYPL